MLSRVLAFKNIFSLLILLWFAYGVWEARDYAYLARLFPFYISMAMFVLSIVNLVQEVRASLHQTAKEGGRGFADLTAAWDIPIDLVWHRFFFYLSIILVLYGFIWLIGYPLSLTLFIIAFYLFFTRSSWWAALLAGITGLGFLALMSEVLGMDWPEGLLRLPWPLG